MKKRVLTLFLVVIITATLIPTTASAADSDFVIENGVLKKYTGSGGDVVIPDGVTRIGGGAFYFCGSVTSVTIPESVTSIERGAFQNLSNLTDFVVAKGNPTYTSQDGVLFNKAKTEIVAYPGGKHGAYTVPTGVTSIGGEAFSYCTSLTGVTLLNGLTSIGDGAFYGCNGLTSVKIPASVTTIKWGAFRRCRNLASVNIPDGVTIIESETFESCTSLTSVTIPASVTSIEMSAFDDCTSLASVNIPTNVTSIGDGVFSGCTSLTSVTIPASVTSIGDYAFSGCTGLSAIQVNANNRNYVSVDGVLFAKDMKTLIVYPGGKQGSYVVPTCVVAIEDSAFHGCAGLTSVTIPEGVTEIVWDMFSACTSLTDVIVPASVTSIKKDAFSDCANLTAIQVDADNPEYVSVDGVLFTKDMTSLLVYPRGKQGNYAIPAGVTSIGWNAFADCAGLTGVTIPDGVTTVEERAFQGCVNLASMIIPASVNTIEDYAFFCEDAPSLTDVYYCGTEAQWKTIDIGYNNYPLEIATIHYDSVPLRTGTMESDSGTSLSWSATAQGEISIPDVSANEKVLVGCYDNNGRFTGVKWLDAQHATAQIDPNTPNVKLFWLGAKQNPLSPSVTVWGK